MKHDVLYSLRFAGNGLTQQSYDRIWAAWKELCADCRRPRTHYLKSIALIYGLKETYDFIMGLPGTWNLSSAHKASFNLWHATARNRRPRDTGPAHYDPHLDKLAAMWYMAWLIMYSRACTLKDIEAAPKIREAGPIDFNPVAAQILLDKTEKLINENA